MKKIIFFSIISAVLIGTVSVGLISCSKDDKYEEEITTKPILGYWYNRIHPHTIEFQDDNTYSFFTEDYGTINGIYRITKSEKTTYYYTYAGGTDQYNATLYKMLVSGIFVFDQMCVYYYRQIGGTQILHVELYAGNEFVKLFTFTRMEE